MPHESGKSSCRSVLGWLVEQLRPRPSVLLSLAGRLGPLACLLAATGFKSQVSHYPSWLTKMDTLCLTLFPSVRAFLSEVLHFSVARAASQAHVSILQEAWNKLHRLRLIRMLALWRE